VLTAIGAYQLDEVLKASERLTERGIPHSVVYMLEPGRFRAPRNKGENEHAARESLREELFPPSVEARIFVVHTKPEPMLGILHPLDTGIQHTRALGFIGNGGTLRFSGMLFVNRCTWAHVLVQVAELLGFPRSALLTPDELSAIDGKASPDGVII
jgi:phosphoketolase